MPTLTYMRDSRSAWARRVTLVRMVRWTLVRRVAPSSLVFAVALFALPVQAADEVPAAPAAGPSEAAIREASDHYEAGLELYADGEFKRAAIEFDRAYELVPNYRALYN